MMVNKVDILAFGAHPDDVECAVSGTLLKHIAMGKTVAIIDLTAGENGSFGNRETRLKESKKASETLGVSYRECLGIRDGAIENNELNRLLVINSIRRYQPEIVLANALHDYHPDHALAANLVSNSVFLSGLEKIQTFHNNELQNKWRPKAVYHYIQDMLDKPDFVIDISEYMSKKMDVILAYKSQFISPKNNAPNSIIRLLEQIKSTNAIFGRPINSNYAEGFNINRYIGVKDLFDLE